MALGVTILTSEAEHRPAWLRALVAAARDAGCGGFVCAASDLARPRASPPSCSPSSPASGWRALSTDDQSRSATPGEAVRRGADMLVIGRAVTGAIDPEQAAVSIVEELANAF